MKRALLALILALPLAVSAQFRIVGTGLFTTINDSTYRAKIDFRPDLTGNSYNPTQLNDSMLVLSQKGQLYRLDSFYNASFSSAFIIVVEKNGNWGSPVGQIMVFQNNSSLAAPQAVYGANGATAGMQAGVDTWNALLLKVVSDSAVYWNQAYSNSIDSAAFSGTATKTLELYRASGDTLKASFVITGGADSLYVAEDADTTLLTNGDTLNLTAYQKRMPFDSVTFNVNETDASLRELKYSEEKGYLQYGGQDSVQIPILPGIWYVRNDTSVTIPKGTVLRATGTLGASGRIKVKHMIANGSIDAMYIIGIAMHDIAVGADGYAMSQGKIRQVNTQAYSEGAVLYADVDTLGGLTQTEPGNGFLKLPIAFVVHSASNGVLAVRVTPGAYMRDLHDVEITSPATNASLYYNTAQGIWRDTGAAVLVADTAAMLTNYINVADTATMLSSYISNADTSVFARDFQISGTSGQVAYFNAANAVTSDAAFRWSAANKSLGINTVTTPSGAQVIVKVQQVPSRSTVVATQTFAADTTNWTRGTGWTFNGTAAVATAATGALTYTPALTITSGNAYEVTYTISGYSAGTLTVAVGNVTYALPTHNATDNIVVLFPTSATGGFRFTTSTFTGNLDNVSVAQINNPASFVFSGQHPSVSDQTLWNSIAMPNSTSYSIGGGARYATGAGNVILGANSGINLTTGSGNVILGSGTAQRLSSGQGNTVFGNSAFLNATTASNNTIIGRESALTITTGSFNNIFGQQAGRQMTTGNNNNLFGTTSGYSITTGSSNNAFGNEAAYGLTTGTNNNVFGTQAGRALGTASDNNLFGNQAGRNLTGSGNNLFGLSAGLNLTTGTFNIMIGNTVGTATTTGSANIFLGYLNNSTSGNGSNNIAIGQETMREGGIGNNNVAIGRTALRVVNDGNANVVIGLNAGSFFTSNNNIAIGNAAGNRISAVDSLTGDNNIVIGNQAADNIITTAAGNVAIGNQVDLPTSNGSNQGVYQNVLFFTGASGTGTTIAAGSRAGIKTNAPASDFHVAGEVRIDDLKPTGAPRNIVGSSSTGDLSTMAWGNGLTVSVGDTTLRVDTSVILPKVNVSGTTNYLAKFTAGNRVGNSTFYENGRSVYINSTQDNSGYSFSNAFQFNGFGSSATDQPVFGVIGNVGTTSNHRPYFSFYRSAGSTVNDKTLVPYNYYLGSVTFQGADGFDFQSRGAEITAITDSITGNNDMPTALFFGTTANGQEQPTERMRITSAGSVGIATASPSRPLHINATTAIRIPVGNFAQRGTSGAGDIRVRNDTANLEFHNGTGWQTVATQSYVTDNAISTVYIPINLYAPGDTVANTTTSKAFFMVHSGLNGYCIDSYTVKAISGSGTADIQIDKNGTGANAQSISGTTVATKDTNIALATGDYVRGQVFNLSGTLVGLGLTLEIKKTCN